MTKHHDAEQRELRRTIEEHLAATRSRSSRPPQSSDYIPEIPRSGRLPQFEAEQLLESGLIPPSGVLEAEAPRRKSLRFVVAGIIGAVALVTAGILLANARSGRQPAAPAISTQPVKLTGTPAQIDRHPPAESIWVSLSATPSDAEIRLDGRRVSNPYRAAHGRDTSLHYILVSASGYEPIEREVSFAHELEAKFALEAKTRSATPRQADPSAAVRQVAGNTRVADPDPVTPPATATVPVPAGESTAGATKPGDDLRGFESRTNKTRDIDETDPYKR